MARIKIRDLPRDMKISRGEMKRIAGGGGLRSYTTYTLSDPLVSSYSAGATGGGSSPLEEVSFNYGKITWEYTEASHDGGGGGNVEADWTVSDNAGS